MQKEQNARNSKKKRNTSSPLAMCELQYFIAGNNSSETKWISERALDVW